MNLLVTGAWSGAQERLASLEQLGHSVLYAQFEKEPLPCRYEWVEGVIGNGLFQFHSVEHFVNLKYIQLTSAGFDRVPMEYVREHGIELHNARGVYSVPMAEFAVAGVLALYKHLPDFQANQSKHRWQKFRNLEELQGKTVCIVGCGEVGTECAKRFLAFGCEVIGVNRTVRADANYSRMIGLESLDTVLPQTDVLILSLALTEETRGLMGADRLLALKSGAVLVNLARGALTETRALIRAMDHLGGAVLDVFEEEPLDAQSPLWDMERVILTPHNSFAGEGNQARLWRVIRGNLVASVVT